MMWRRKSIAGIAQREEKPCHRATEVKNVDPAEKVGVKLLATSNENPFHGSAHRSSGYGI
jgi:hypothetical protein